MSLNGAGGIMHDKIRRSAGWEVQYLSPIPALGCRGPRASRPPFQMIDSCRATTRCAERLSSNQLRHVLQRAYPAYQECGRVESEARSGCGQAGLKE